MFPDGSRPLMQHNNYSDADSWPLYIRASAQSKAGPIHLHMGLHLGHFFGIGSMIESSNIKWLGPSIGPKPLINHLQ